LRQMQNDASGRLKNRPMKRRVEAT
jgi:hypothetical protein